MWSMADRGGATDLRFFQILSELPRVHKSEIKAKRNKHLGSTHFPQAPCYPSHCSYLHPILFPRTLLSNESSSSLPSPPDHHASSRVSITSQRPRLRWCPIGVGPPKIREGWFARLNGHGLLRIVSFDRGCGTKER